MKKLIARAVVMVLALGGLGLAAAPSASAAVPTVSATCSSLDVMLDGYPDGTTVTTTVDGESVVETAEGGWYSAWRGFDWSTAHEWSVVVDASEGSDGDFSDGGTTTPCDVDPDRYAFANASCGEVTAHAASYPAGTRLVVSVDGQTVTDDPVEGYYGRSWPIDWTVAHDWTVTLDAVDDALDQVWEGVTEPCDVDPRLRVEVGAYCDQFSVSVTGYPAGTTVEVRLDDAPFADGVVNEWDEFWGSWTIGADTTHTWEVVIDAEDDSLDRTESGESEPCWTEPGEVLPETPATVTACSATPDDVVLPADSEAVSYERTPEGIVATATDGYVFPWDGLDQWQRLDDARAVLSWHSAVRPVCDLEVVSVTPVCVEGSPFVDVVVTPPVGADAGSLEMDWVGPDAAYDVVYGSGGFGQPFESRQPWPAFITNEDGTVSPHHTPDWRLDDIDLAFGTTMQADGGAYSRYHRAIWEDAPTVDPCADDPGPHFSVEARERSLAGKPYLAVRVLNEDDTAADVTIATPLGSRTFHDVAPGASAYQAYPLRTEMQDVPVTVTFTTDLRGQRVTRERVVRSWLAS